MSTASGTTASAGFWDSRAGLRALGRTLLLEPVSGGASWAVAFGSLLLFTVAVQVVTGILLSMAYAPAVVTAWPSVAYIQNEMPLGRFIRAVHHWGASAMMILLLAHLVQVFVWGAYKRPRELTWMVGVLLLAITLGLGFTGYLLPWDAKAYWATKVGLGIVSTIPFVGQPLRTVLQGGDQIGNLTLTRFFALHAFVLPGLLIAGIAVHLYLFRLHGVTPAWWKSQTRLNDEEEPFWPGQVFKDAVLIFLLMVGLAVWCWFRSAPLGPVADPAQPYNARPEWYFMFLFQVLKCFPPPYEVVGTFVLPSLFFAVLLFWPLLDRSPHRDPRRRPIAISLLGLSSAGLVGMTVFAIRTDVRMTEPVLAQVAAKATDATPVPPKAPAGPIQKLDVPKIYSENCEECHGVDGTGTQLRVALPTIPDFTNLAWQREQSDERLISEINGGSGTLMPPFKGKLTDEQIHWLSIYVRGFALKPTAAGAATTATTESTAASPASPAKANGQ